MREYRLAPGEVVACGIGAEELFNLVAYEVDPGIVGRVDLVLLDRDGATLLRVEDVPVDRPTGTVWALELGDELRKLPDMRFTSRLVGVDADGAERLLGEYGLDHTAYRGR
jgi:hypothetical protein